MKVNITLSNDEILKTEISRSTYNYVKNKLSEDTVLSECIKNVEIIK